MKTYSVNNNFFVSALESLKKSEFIKNQSKLIDYFIYYQDYAIH